MRGKVILVFLFSLCSFVPIYSQQSYFNVPSTDRTPKGTFFFQEQLSIDADEVISNTTFDWGITHNWEAGFNIAQINFDPNFNFRRAPESTLSQDQIFPLITLNSQYFYQINPHNQLAIAGVWGYSPVHHFKINNQAGFFFLNEKYCPNPDFKLTVGVNTGNIHYSGLGTWMDGTPKNFAFGYQIGAEINLYKEKLFFVGDHISGRNSLGYSTAGFALKIPNHWILSFGALIANPNSGNANGLVLEFTRAIHE